jgi:hypothetical protein
MRYLTSTNTGNALTGAPRAGKVTMLLLFILPLILLPAFGLAVNPPLLNEARGALQNAADAAALAAAGALVEERALLNDRTAALALLADARAEGKLYARRNVALGKPLELVTTVENRPNEDLVFGSAPPAGPKVFTPVHPGSLSTPLWKTVNAVHVSAKRSRERGTQVPLIGGSLFGLQPVDIVAQVTVRLDRHVIGFRPRVGHNIPAAPIALRSDRSSQPDRCSWEFQVERRGGTDAWRWHRAGRKLVPDGHGDGLFEMTVHLGTPGMAPKGKGKGGGGKSGQAHDGRINSALLQLGAEEAGDLARQLLTGVTVDDLKEFGGELVLRGPGPGLPVLGTLWGPAPGGWDGAQLKTALQELQSRGDCRIWPLFTHVDPSTRTPVLSGFVAARVARVDSPGPHGGLSFVLQPCMTSTTTALIDASSRDGAGAVTENPYVCKVRIVQ